MKIEKIESYNAPEGNHSGRIIDAKMKPSENLEGSESIRITIEVTSAEHPLYCYRVGKTYTENQGAQFARDVFAIVGMDLTGMMNPDGEIIESELGTLIGRPVAFDVIHRHTTKYPKPFCDVQNLRAAPEPRQDDLRKAA